MPIDPALDPADFRGFNLPKFYADRRAAGSDNAPVHGRPGLARVPDLATRAMHLCLSKSDGLTLETAGAWGRNVEVRRAELLALDEKETKKLLNKRGSSLQAGRRAKWSVSSHLGQ